MVRLNFGPMAKKAKEKEPEAEYIPPDEEDLAADDSVLDSMLERKDDEDIVPEERDKVAKLDPLRKYLLEVSHFEPLTPEEEHRLAILYRDENNEQAAYRLVTSNLRLVVKIAFLYSRIYQNVMDLIQEGNIGLMEAVKRFDPYRGARLPTYAVWWIKAYIIKFILDNFRIVRLGTTNERRKLLFNLRKEKEKLRLQGIEPTAALVAARLNVKPEEIEAVEGTIEGSDLSLDSYVNDQDDTRYVDTLAATEELIDDKLARGELRSLFQQKFQEFARNLSERERVILEQRLIADEPKTLQEIADQFGVTREAIRLNEKALVGRIRNYMQTELKDVTRV
ncbi:MAG: sigma-70 family RNA polymerase sigma factor, partial [Acidobacteria bacterium]